MYLYDKRITSVFIIMVLFSVVISAQPYNQTFPNQTFGIDESLKRAINENGAMTPVLNQIQEITSNDGATGDQFGNSVSIDADTAIVGADFHDDGEFDNGSAYIFIRSGAVWTQQAKLSNGRILSEFGNSVSIDGDTAIVGAVNDYDGGPATGSAYVFTRSGTTWTQQANLIASDAAGNDEFGISVSIDGDTAIVGAYANDDNGFNSGSAYIFTRSGKTWTQQAKLTASDAAGGDFFGWSVSIDGETVVIGARQNDDGDPNSGSAYIFTRSGAIWTEQTKLTASDAARSDLFGNSVSIDGDTVIVGARWDDDGGSDNGSAYVFTRSGVAWTEQAKLTASDTATTDNFGKSVSIDGDTVVVGSLGDDDGASDSGSAYVFTRSGMTWTEHRKLIVSSGTSGDENGISVSISGMTVITGAHLRDIAALSPFKDVTKHASGKSVTSKFSNLAGTDQGAAFFFNLLPPTASSATISGRVLSRNGRAIPRAVVYLTAQDGESITLRTNQFGHFKFEDIEVGQTLVMNVFSKRYQFQTQVINFDDSINGLEFIADK